MKRAKWNRQGSEDLKERDYIPYTESCFACGANNMSGLRLELYREEESIRGEVVIEEHLIGYTGMAHGGVVCSLLDEAMIWSAVILGSRRTMYVTTELSVRYLAPVPAGEVVSVVGRLVEEKGRMAKCEGEVVRDGKALATGSARFLSLSGDRGKKAISQIRFDRSPRYVNFFE